MFGAFLNSILEARGWGAVQLAAALNEQGMETHTSTVERWLRGKGFPRWEMVEPLCRALGLEPNELFGFSIADCRLPIEEKNGTVGTSGTIGKEKRSPERRGLANSGAGAP